MGTYIIRRLLQAVVILLGLSVVFLLTDLTYAWVDPRIRYD